MSTPAPEPLLDPAGLIAQQQPVVLRGLVRDWPLVAKGFEGPEAAVAYLKSFYTGTAVVGYSGPPEIAGRFFYNADMTAMNFTATRVKLDAFLDRMLATRDDPHAAALYVGSTDLDTYLPGFRAENDLALPPEAVGGATPLASIWIGNRTTAATHYDMSNNIACCLVGRRRFTLFPPEQIRNLYVGPLEFTLAGQPTSMVDLEAPDFEVYPRFAEALDHAQSAELGPGDAIFIPSLWWHNVAALAPLNVLVNTWWGQANETPAFAALIHALLSIRDVAPAERTAWRDWFDHYVFGEDAHKSADHLPASARGVLSAASPGRTEQLKRYLQRSLERR